MEAGGKRLGCDPDRTRRSAWLAVRTGVGALVLALAAGSAAAAQFETIYRFMDNGAGRDPSGELTIDGLGRLYGTTERGGAVCPDASYSCGGTVYRLRSPRSPGGAWRHNVLHSFPGGRAGSTPKAGVIQSSDGTLSGTTHYGGVVSCEFETRGWGCGTVFQLLPPEEGKRRWTKRILHRFEGEEDGRFPDEPLGRRADGTLFGSTERGGASDGGVAFTITFPGGAAGRSVYANTTARDIDDELFEAIRKWIGKVGGKYPSSPEDCPQGTHWFEFNRTCFPDAPYGGVYPANASRRAFKTDGSLYGTAFADGDSDCVFTAFGCGVVYRLRPPADPSNPWRYSVLHSFLGGSDGAFPNAGVTIGPDRSLYGTTSQGGVLCPNDEARGCGVIYRLLPPSGPSSAWQYQVLYRFKGGLDGAKPFGQLALGPDGALYGATRAGGGCSFTSGGCGTVYKLTPPSEPGKRWTRTILHRFQAGAEGAFPNGSVLLAADGALYGVTTYTVYRIAP